jgi:hypothetical protein
VANDGQAQAETAVLPFAGTVGLPKTVENVRQKFRRDAFAVVGDDDFDVRIDLFEPHLHFPVALGKLYRVREQIPDDLLQAVGVAGNRSGVRIENFCRRMQRASAAGRTASSAASIIAARLTGCTSSRTLPLMMRETSRRSSIN